MLGSLGARWGIEGGLRGVDIHVKRLGGLGHAETTEGY